MQINKAISCVLLLFVLVFSSVVHAKTDEATDNIYTEDKPNIAVSSDQPEFTLKLKSNPTTGYSWFLREYDTSLVTAVKHKFIPGSEKLIGAAGFELWTFKIKPLGFSVPHQTTIRLIYARPWQGVDSSTQVVFRVSTISKPKN